MSSPGLRSARVVAGFLISGVVLFWIVAWWLTDGGQVGIEPEGLPPELAFWVWAGVAIPSFVMAMAFHRKALRFTAEASRTDVKGLTTAEAGEVQTHLICAWAMLEGPALMSGVFFLLLALHPVLWLATIVYGIGMLITYPRAEWFGEQEGQGVRSEYRRIGQ